MCSFRTHWLLLAWCVSPAAVSAKLPAFPGAEGAGMYATGGRGGNVVHVTNLDDAGPGSLREAVSKPGCTVIFDVGGTIRLESRLNIFVGNLTIAGQTAPGGGICLAGDGVQIRGSDVVLRYIRVRPGYENGGDGIWVYVGSRNVIIDHVSATWANDEGISCTRDCGNITVQWCLIAQGLNYRGHAYGAIIDPEGKATYHHNLWAHNKSRSPRTADSDVVDFRNNVVYNWSYRTGYNGKDQAAPLNFVNNYYKYGPDTVDEYKRKLIFAHGSKQTRMYAAGNFVWGYPGVTADNWRGMIYRDGAAEADVRVGRPFAAASVTTQSPEAAFSLVLQHAGASRKRDAVDRRIVAEVRSGKGRIIDHHDGVGGWPDLSPAAPPADADRDGMPDAWEKAQGLDPNNAQDRNGDLDADGYTNLEEYLNSLVPDLIGVKRASS